MKGNEAHLLLSAFGAGHVRHVRPSASPGGRSGGSIWRQAGHPFKNPQ